MSTNLEKAGYSFVGAVGGHICSQIARNIKTSGDHPLNNRVGEVFAMYTDYVQLPLNQISILKTRLLQSFEMGDVDQQIRLGAWSNFITRILIAPIIEETIYRGPQLLGGALLEQSLGMYAVPSQIIIGSATNTMFGLSHTAGVLNRRLNSNNFKDSFSKGLVLSVIGGMVMILTNNKNNKEEGATIKQSLKAVGNGLIVAIVAHSLSNLPMALKEFKRALSALE